MGRIRCARLLHSRGHDFRDPYRGLVRCAGNRQAYSFPAGRFFVFGTGEQEGKLIAERIYFDNDTVMRQIRGEMDASEVADFPLPAVATLSSPR